MSKPTNAPYRFQRGHGSVLLIACGALAREIIAVIERNQLTHLDLACLPAELHHRPILIPEAVRQKIQTNREYYDNILVLYGDCGTAGALDKVLEEEGGISRIPGPHCFSFFMGNAVFDQAADDNVTTFYLTDFFCRHFEKIVWEPLGLDRHESMVEFVFGNYETLLFMPQLPDPELEAKAKIIAECLGLRYRYEFAGYGEMERFLSLA